jgi:hypothetical protein
MHQHYSKMQSHIIGDSQAKSHQSSNTCTLCTNSKVVASQIEKERIAREPTTESYLALVRRMESYFKGFTVEHIKRSENSEPDCHTPFRERGNEASIRVPRMFKSHAW